MSKRGTFTLVSSSRYVMTVSDYGLTFDLDRVRRERSELFGELVVRCELKGARTIEGILAASDFNVSGQTSRQTRAKYLQERAQAPDIDFVGLLDEFCQRVIAFDRSGSDAPILREIVIPERGIGWTVDGLTLLERHPVILFGDGGQGKSLVALYLVGQLARQGIQILYCDWEFDGESHRARYGALFGEEMPHTIRYARCDRPMAQEVDRLRRLVRQYGVEYLVCDSIVFACGAGVPAESAEAAATYYQALRQIGIGSLNLAHTTKQGSEADDTRQQAKPFGSVFWANGARATWFLRGVPEYHRLAISLYPRKANTGPLGSPIGWSVLFEDDRIEFSPLDVASHPDLGKSLPVWERMQNELRRGAQTYKTLSDALEIPVNTVVQEVKRKDRIFTRIDAPGEVTKIGLLM